MGVMQVDFQVAKIEISFFLSHSGWEKAFKISKILLGQKNISHIALVNGSVTINFIVPWIRP